MVRTIIVDDEPEAREGLISLLSEVKEIEIVAVCENGIKAVEQIEDLKPDLVFLDIQMPKVNGFEVLNSLTYQIPYVVFVTAFDQYAWKAFEVNAQDYLLKPFSNERFEVVLELALKNLKEKSDQSTVLGKMIQEYLVNQNESEEGEVLHISKSGKWNKLTIKTAGRISFVDYAEIKWIEGYDYCVKVHTDKKLHVVRTSLKQMEIRLKEYQFVRVSKSAIVNMNMVKEIEPHFNGGSVLTLDNEIKVKLSKSYKKNLSDFLIE